MYQKCNRSFTILNYGDFRNSHLAHGFIVSNCKTFVSCCFCLYFQIITSMYITFSLLYQNSIFIHILNCELFNQQNCQVSFLTFNHLCHITIRINTSNMFGMSRVNVSSKKKRYKEKQMVITCLYTWDSIACQSSTIPPTYWLAQRSV